MMDARQWSMLLVSHALQVTFLVLIVAGVTRLCAKNRPHLAHMLWIVVLLKCIAPPFWSSPASVFSWLGTAVASVRMAESQRDVSTVNSPKTASEVATKDANSKPWQGDFTTSTSELDSVAARSGSDAAIAPAPNDHTWQPALRIVLSILIIGFVVGLAYASIRLMLFLRAAYKSGYDEDTPINETVERLRQRLGIKRQVRVHLINCPIGPAVVGLLRPTLLLPKLLVTGKDDTHLEPLLAHELIHIRRGDLWWSILQTLATYLWWFHPGVRCAARMATLEAERACDEEAVLSLGCSPATYARALLEVLERRHELLLAPGLPGVRPVDITLKRMERIMHLGQGSHRRSPRWFWGLLFVTSVLVLPSAALSSPQESPPAPGPVPKATGPIADAFENYRCDVGDLLDILQRNDFTEEEARQHVLGRLPSRSTTDFERVASELGLPGELKVTLPSPQIVNRELRVFELKSQVAAIKSILAQLRKSGLRQDTYQVQFFECSFAHYKTLLNTCPGIVRAFESETVGRFRAIEIRQDLQKSIKFAPNTLWIERPHQTTVASGRWQTLQGSPTISPHTNAEVPNVFVIDNKGLKFLTSNPHVKLIGGGASTTDSGRSRDMRIQSQGVLSENGQAVATTVNSLMLKASPLDHLSCQINVELVSYQKPSSKDAAKDTQASFGPELQVKLLETLASGETLVLGGVRTKALGLDEVLLVSVTMTSELKKELAQNVLLKLKALADAPPLPIIGAVTKAGDKSEVQHPTVNELAHAIETSLGDLGEDKQFKFELRKTGERTDSARFIPLIGNAKLHHTFYECTFASRAHPEISGTIKLDHNHFEIIENEGDNPTKN